jgi:hypothetical protein
VINDDDASILVDSPNAAKTITNRLSRIEGANTEGELVQAVRISSGTAQGNGLQSDL